MESDDTVATNGENTSSENGDSSAMPPLFEVHISQVMKDGENVNFTLSSNKVNSTDKFSVRRQFEDFLWLHHCITAQNEIDGVLVPPLPVKPLIEPKGVEAKSKQQLGKDSTVLIADKFHNDCRRHEIYLNQLINHHMLGRDKTLEKFLTEKEPAVRAKLKKGIVSKLTSAVEEVRKGGHKDIDEHFQKERDWANEYSANMKETSRNFNKMVYAQQRLALAHTHMCTALALNLSASNNAEDTDTTLINKLLLNFSEAIDNVKKGVETVSSSDMDTLGFQLELYDRYLESVKDMLYRRTLLLVSYENANKAMDKAKAQKRQSAEEVKEAAEKAFEACSESAKVELETFHKERVAAVSEALVKYAEGKVKSARDTYGMLENSLSAIRDLE